MPTTRHKPTNVQSGEGIDMIGGIIVDLWSGTCNGQLPGITWARLVFCEDFALEDIPSQDVSLRAWRAVGCHPVGVLACQMWQLVP